MKYHIKSHFFKNVSKYSWMNFCKSKNFRRWIFCNYDF